MLLSLPRVASSIPPPGVHAHDPRVQTNESSQAAPEHYIPDDDSPSFETYLYYAEKQRNKEAVEASKQGLHPPTGWLSNLFDLNRSLSDQATHDYPREKKNASVENAFSTVTPAEYRAASSALRTATWGSIFYLITTDILGPYSAPYAFSAVGFGPGVACFIVFGIMAAYSGVLLWYLFLKLDSERFPLRTFGDMAYRLYGSWFRILCNVLQSLQLVFNVGIILLGNGQSLSQMAQFRLCFSVCNVVWMLAGMILGQIRTLQKFSWIANFSIWLNIIAIIMTMGAVAHTPPNYAAAESAYGITQGPVQTLAINQQPFESQLNGIMQIVYSYGGTMIFIEFMAEMRRPIDFWKAMACAQVFICFVYMLFGLFVYGYQGQYVINPAVQGISLYSLQTATNAIYLTASIIGATLYGNIGVKVIYQSILIELFRAPPLTIKTGKYLFAACVIVYWSLVFVISSAIPQYTNLSSLVAAVCIFQFSYTFPPFMILGYNMQVDAMCKDGAYNVNNPHGSRIDSWRSISRWVRGYKKRIIFNTWNLVLTLACLATAGLASYSAIESIITGLKTSGSATSFGCRSPVQ